MSTDPEIRSVAVALTRRFGEEDETEVTDETRSYAPGFFQRLESLLADDDEPLIVDYAAETFTLGCKRGSLVDEELADVRRRVAHNRATYERRSLSLADTAGTPAARSPSLVGDSVGLRGHAAVFDLPSADLGGFTERIAVGAFRDILRRQTPVALLNNHDWNTILASTKSTTLRLAEDATGLAINARLDPADPDVQRVLPKMRRGDLAGMSFAFKSKRDAWTRNHKGGVLRTVLEVAKMSEVSLCPRPAYPDATCSLLRSARELIREQDTAERQRVHTRLRITQLAAPPVAA